MKKLELKKEAIASLSDQEMNNAKGGTWGWVIGLGVAAGVAWVYEAGTFEYDFDHGGHTATCGAGNNSGCDC